MYTLLKNSFPVYTKILELHTYMNRFPAGSMINPADFADYYEISTRQAIRDFQLGAEQGLPLEKTSAGWQISHGSDVIVLPFTRVPEEEVTALASASEAFEGDIIGSHLSRLAGIFGEMKAQVPGDMSHAKGKKISETARLALLDELLHCNDGLSKNQIADRVVAGQERSIGRYCNFIERLGGDIVYDRESKEYYQAGKFYFGSAFLNIDTFDALEWAMDELPDRDTVTLLESVKIRLDRALGIVAQNTCLESFVEQSHAIREVLDYYHARELTLYKMPSASEYGPNASVSSLAA